MSNQQYEARDIERILGINRNKLYHWTHSHRLLVPEIAEAEGTGRRARYSIRNLVELAFIKSLEDFGIDLRSIQNIKTILDRPDSRFDDGNVFDFALKTMFSKYLSVLLYKHDRMGYVAKIEGVFEGMEADFDKDGGACPAPGEDEFFLGYSGDESNLSRYVSFKIGLGKIAQDIKAKESEA